MSQHSFLGTQLFGLFLVTTTLFSCQTGTRYSFSPNGRETLCKVGPFQGVSFNGLRGSHNDLELRFWAADSSVFYLTTFTNTLNQEFINNDSLVWNWHRALKENTSLGRQGYDIASNQYWKGSLHNGFIVGYQQVSAAQKPRFDSIINQLIEQCKE